MTHAKMLWLLPLLLLLSEVVQPSWSASSSSSWLPEKLHRNAPFGWPLAAENWDAVALHVRNLVNLPRRNLRHIDFSVEESRDKEDAELSVDEQLVNNIRMFPEHVAAARRFFHVLDTNNNGYVQEPEFLNAMYRTEPNAPAAPQQVLKDAGEEVFRAFTAPELYMEFPAFCRFLVIMSYEHPADFKWKKSDIEALRSDNLGNLVNISKTRLFKTFVIFDEDSDGGITKEEFTHVYMDELYWSLRYKDKLPHGVLDTSEEYEYARTRFNRYTEGKESLGLPAFIRLLQDARDKRPPLPVGGGEGCITCRLTPEWAKVVKSKSVSFFPILTSTLFVSTGIMMI